MKKKDFLMYLFLVSAFCMKLYNEVFTLVNKKIVIKNKSNRISKQRTIYEEQRTQEMVQKDPIVRQSFMESKS